MTKFTCSQHFNRVRLVPILSLVAVLGLGPNALADTGADAEPVPVVASVASLPAGDGSGTVLGDRCNVRSRPSTTAEVVVQVNQGAIVRIVDQKNVTEGGRSRDWLNIQLPAEAKCYVATRYLADGVVTADSLYVRCGAGKNYRHVGKLAKSDRVDILAQEGEWTRITPTDDCTGWIAAELVEIATTPVPAPKPAALAEPAIVVTEIVADEPAVPLEPVVPASAEPSVVERVQVISTDPDIHVVYVLKDGILMTASSTADAPADYQLMRETNMGRRHLMCYLVAPDGVDMTRFEEKEVRVAGNLLWHKGDRYPVLNADRIERVW